MAGDVDDYAAEAWVQCPRCFRPVHALDVFTFGSFGFQVEELFEAK